MKLTTDSLNVVVIGNFDVVAGTVNIAFPNTGTWYSYLTGSTRSATGAIESISLQPGEYYVYTNKDVRNLITTALLPVADINLQMPLSIAPNPVNQNATIRYDLPESGLVSIQIRSIDGKNNQSVFNGYQAKGLHSMNLYNNATSVKQFSSGAYLLQLLVNGKQKIEKFIIEK